MAASGTGKSATTLTNTQQNIIRYSVENWWNKMQQKHDLHKRVAWLLNDLQEDMPYKGDVSSTQIKHFTGEVPFGGFRTFSNTLKVHEFVDGKLLPRHMTRFSVFNRQLASIEMMAASAGRFLERITLNALAAGDQLTGAVADYLVSANQIKGTGTQSNKGSVAFSRTNLKTALTAMDQYYDISGTDQLEVTPDLLILNRASQWTADEFLPGPTVVVAGSTDSVRTAKNEFAKRGLEDVYCKELSTSQFILVDTSWPIKPVMVNLPFKSSDDPSALGYELRMWEDNDHDADKVSIIFYTGAAATEHWYLMYSSVDAGTGFPTLINPATKKGIV